jgi:hypothetical protein
LIENYEHHRYINVDGTPATRPAPVVEHPAPHADHHDDDEDEEEDDGEHGQKATAHVPGSHRRRTFIFAKKKLKKPNAGVDAAQLAADPFDEFVSLRAVRCCSLWLHSFLISSPV